MMSFTGQTQIYGIIGDPISHSLSPLMQNAAIAAAGLDACYLPFHVPSAQLGAAVEGLRALGIDGFNVTLPHKQQILSRLDWVDENATLIGAVNTVVCRQRCLHGYNTDCSGFLRALREDLQFEPAGRNVLLFGAGGACRAALVALLRSQAQNLWLVNRRLDKAQGLAQEFQELFPDQQISAHSLQDTTYRQLLSQADLIVNTTSVGLRGEDLECCPLERVKAGTVVYDMVYTVVETAFVHRARRQGLSAADGLNMLAAQGEDAFFLWHDILAEKGLMKKSLHAWRRTHSH